MRMALCIQCRDGSTRLKHKSVRPFYKGKSILELIISRLKNVRLKNIFVLTTENSPITQKQAKDLGVKVFVGSEDDVHDRFFRFILRYKFDGVIRICADNPFISLALMYPIRKWAKSGCYDYVSFKDAMKRHEGLFVEYISARAIIDMVDRELKESDKEHVTPFIRMNPHLYISKILPIPPEFDEIPIRLTVDTKEDFDVSKKVYSYIGEGYWMEILKYIYNNERIHKKMLKNIEMNPKNVQ